MSQRPVEAAIAAIREGLPVVVTDHPDREDEGDLVIAAQCASPEWVAFMMRECRGLICAPILAARADELGLPPMVPQNAEALRTAFTVSVDAAQGVTTGISASDRAKAIAILVDPARGSGDLVRPGHLFPLVAAEGGVVARPGHTEAAVDLARLAGWEPAGVICEIAGEDGEMLRGADLRAFSEAHGFVQVSIDELVEYMAV
ncbi:3,4-dihydroxy-2-butanone-4-phosphate synthase [Demequina silvatica]|uniref:3,4-dihydroxy-2-butanone-4-phosphate synthase n=1 Tax=Demequina silvatica TaxID=1638988 RepID=UPI000783B5C8|nr:3,4-dihydroxy-2-butanone-4-phosphate synthase [Demequina silvatica]